jgi:hypothetical protein
MGSFLEFNDTLQLTTEQGFPLELQLDSHLQEALTAALFKDRIFAFSKPGLRVFHPSPTRCLLVHNIDGKWLYWGQCEIIEQTMHAKQKLTTGKFIITKIYLPEQQRMMSRNDVPDGKEYMF